MHLFGGTSGGTGGMTYISLGLVAAYHWTVGDFTKDSLWHTLDISAHIPTTAKFVVFHARVRHTGANQQFVVCPYNENTTINALSLWSPAANAYIDGYSPPIEVDSDRRVNYYVKSGATYNNLDLAVVGYWQ